MRQLTEVEMAEALNVTPRTLRKWRYERIVPYTKIGYIIRYDAEAVFRALKAYECKPLAAMKGAKA
jgi:DNA-binding transcriptional MerR regulator